MTINFPQTNHIGSKVVERTYSVVTIIIDRLLILLEIFLFLRLLLKFLNANPYTWIVSVIYKYSDIIISPFGYIFKDIYLPTGQFIETTTFAAMIGYALFVLIIGQLLKLFFKEEF